MKTLSENLDDAEAGIRRIDANLKKVGELTAASMLEVQANGETPSEASVLALSGIIKTLDGLSELDRASVFQCLSDFEAVRSESNKRSAQT